MTLYLTWLFFVVLVLTLCLSYPSFLLMICFFLLTHFTCCIIFIFRIIVFSAVVSCFTTSPVCVFSHFSFCVSFWFTTHFHTCFIFILFPSPSPLCESFCFTFPLCESFCFTSPLCESFWVTSLGNILVCTFFFGSSLFSHYLCKFFIFTLFVWVLYFHIICESSFFTSLCEFLCVIFLVGNFIWFTSLADAFICFTSLAGVFLFFTSLVGDFFCFTSLVGDFFGFTSLVGDFFSWAAFIIISHYCAEDLKSSILAHWL